MIRRRLVAVAAAAALAASGALVAPLPASAAADPDPVTALTSRPYSGNRMLISWSAGGGNTSYWLVKTGLTGFSNGSPGRNATTLKVPAEARSYKLTEVDLARAGAAIGTGRQLYYKVYAVNEANGVTRTSAFPYQRALLPRGLAAKAKGTKVRIATFNVRTAKATWDKRHWMKRKLLVAGEIKASGADIVMIQELSPGRQDGKDGSTKKVGRQTTSLVNAMRKVGRGQFKLVRETQYKNPGEVHGTQGTRILYNSAKYELLSNCPEKRKGKNYNPACSIDLPIGKGDSGKAKRKAAYAAFESRSTGKRFYVVSAHLDQRHSKSLKTEQKYNALRGAQAKKIIDRIDQINTRNRAVIFGGDINSWQTNIAGDAPRDQLIENGFYDTVNAVEQVNIDFPTINHYKPVLERSTTGVGTRIDMLAVRGSQGANLYWNMTRQNDAHRPSDHNLIAADIVL